MSDIIILVHGLWMTGIELAVMRHRLQTEYGFSCVLFSYASVTGSMTDHVQKLGELARAQHAEKLHFVGHSLGGIVTYKLLESTHDLAPGRAVFMGSPLQGSTAATAMTRWTLGRVAVGEEVRKELTEGQPRHWDGRRDIGIIAGSVNRGVGRFFSQALSDHSDGTVLIDETKLDGAKDHIVLPVTHTSMVFSPGVTAQVAHFLRNGSFDHSGVEHAQDQW